MIIEVRLASANTRKISTSFDLIRVLENFLEVESNLRSVCFIGS